MSSSLPRPSRRMLAWFSLYLRWYVPRHFRALRVAHSARFVEGVHPSSGGSFRPSSPGGTPDPAAAAGPAVLVALNHPSWWDPLTCILISRHLLPGYDHYAPMDAAEAARYRILASMGLFPVEQNSPRGAAQFLRAGKEILSRPKSLLWITPQGEFTDARQRPVEFRPGLSALVARLPEAVVIPLAIEYVFWNERLPEVLVNCGSPVVFRGEAANAAAIDAQLVAALTATQDELAALALARNPSRFETVLDGQTGTGNIYALWQRARSFVTGQAYHREHRSHRP
jgi:1-acyl-sn-glycerol-3-phosphate acyltransferase